MAFVATSLLSAGTLSGCNSNKDSKSDEKDEERRGSIVVFYSQTGATEDVGEELARQLGVEEEEIEPTDPYTGSYDETIERVRKEMVTGTLPTLRPLETPLADYDTIYLGYPVWFGTCATPIKALARIDDLAGKTVITFCTFGSGGLQASTDSVAALFPKAKVTAGYGVRNALVADSPSGINRFLIEKGLKPGKVESLPPFGEQKPVTYEEKQIFDVACGGYKYPLGSPVTAASRQIPEGTEYSFKADTGTTIFVTAPSEMGEEPYFTEVIR